MSKSNLLLSSQPAQFHESQLICLSTNRKMHVILSIYTFTWQQTSIVLRVFDSDCRNASRNFFSRLFRVLDFRNVQLLFISYLCLHGSKWEYSTCFSLLEPTQATRPADMLRLRLLISLGFLAISEKAARNLFKIPTRIFPIFPVSPSDSSATISLVKLQIFP